MFLDNAPALGKASNLQIVLEPTARTEESENRTSWRILVNTKRVIDEAISNFAQKRWTNWRLSFALVELTWRRQRNGAFYSLVQQPAFRDIMKSLCFDVRSRSWEMTNLQKHGIACQEVCHACTKYRNWRAAVSHKGKESFLEIHARKIDKFGTQFWIADVESKFLRNGFWNLGREELRLEI